MRIVSETDAGFLHALMNDESVMAALNEVSTTASAWAEAIAEWANDGDEEDSIIRNGDTPVGWVGVNGLSSEDKSAYIKMIALLPAYQGRGIGERVVRDVIEDLKMRGYTSLNLFTDQANAQAQRCYTKCGFEIVGELKQTMSNGTIVSRYRMERKLK